MDGVFGDAAAAVVGDDQPFSAGVDGEVARSIAARRDLIEEMQLPGLRVQCKGAYGARWLALERGEFIDGVEKLAIGMDGEEGRVGSFGDEAEGRQLAVGRREAPSVNALTLVRPGVSADVSDVVAL